MSGQSHSWYIRGEGNQPAGPFTTEELLQSWRAGRLRTNTICWREGMSHWLALGQVEPFASVMASANAPPATRADVPSSPLAARQPGGRRGHWPASIGWAIGGGAAAICALVAGAVLLFSAHKPVGTPGAADSEDSASQDWGLPVRVRMMGGNQQVETTFLVGLKDAWWTDYGSSEDKKTFMAVYYYKNLGPRERGFSLGINGPFSNDKVEIRTDKGQIFAGHNFDAGRMPSLFGPGPEKRDVGGWQPTETAKIEETGESALVFEIPPDQIPTELIASGSLDLDVKLPQGPFGFRPYCQVFGFLPARGEKVVPGLIEALHDKDWQVRKAAMEALGKLGPAAKDAVPAATTALLRDQSMDVRKEAAIMLGQIGPEAREAIPALKRPFRESDPRGALNYSADFYAAVYEALVRVGGAGEAIPTIREDLKQARAPSLAGTQSDHMAVFAALMQLAPRVREIIPALAEAINDEGTLWHERRDGAKRLGEIGPAAVEAVPILKGTLQSLERTGAIQRDSGHREIYDAIKEALPKIDPHWESVPAAAVSSTPLPTEPNASSSGPTKPMPPREDGMAARNVPPGFREAVNNLLQRLREQHDLSGNFADYRLIIPPNYKGNETRYEIALDRPGFNFYVFRTVDGGQTWSPFPPTNPYLIKILNDRTNQRLQEAARNASSGTTRADRPNPGPRAERPQIPRAPGALVLPGATPPVDDEPRLKGPLSGTWLASAGATFRIEDDGETAAVRLIQANALQTFSGKLTRGGKGPDSKSLTGTLDAVFRPDAPKRHAIRVTATLDDQDRLHLRCSDWPIWNTRGRLSTQTLSETWTRQP